MKAKIDKTRLDRYAGMNKTEAAFATVLGLDPKVISWKFEPFKLRLAKGCYYSPDFFVVTREGEPIIYEVKGFWRDDARVKIKTAAEKFREFRFIAVQRKKGQWVYEDFG